MDMIIPLLELKILLESNPPKSRILVQRLTVGEVGATPPTCATRRWRCASPARAKNIIINIIMITIIIIIMITILIIMMMIIDIIIVIIIIMIRLLLIMIKQ